MKSFLIYTLSITILLLLNACSTDKIPGVYRIDIQQGNKVTQEMLNKLQPGMTKNQVTYIMGTPLIEDTFHPERWDYLYSFQPGNGEREQRRITLYFNKDEKLSYITGDIKTVPKNLIKQVQEQDANVEVPLTEKKTGLFDSLLHSIGIGEDDQEIAKDTKKTEDKSTTKSTDTSKEKQAEPTAQP